MCVFSKQGPDDVTQNIWNDHILRNRLIKEVLLKIDSCFPPKIYIFGYSEYGNLNNVQSSLNVYRWRHD